MHLGWVDLVNTDYAEIDSMILVWLSSLAGNMLYFYCHVLNITFLCNYAVVIREQICNWIMFYMNIMRIGLSYYSVTSSLWCLLASNQSLFCFNSC